MRIALDTSAYSALDHADDSVLRVLQDVSVLGVSAVVLGELYSGFRKGSREAWNREMLTRFLSKRSVRILPVTEETALRYAEIDEILRKKGRPIPRNDMWIAASAIEHGMQLLAVDKHFHEIPMLIVRP